MNEIWIDIMGYENKYQVSNTGKIRSLNYNNTGKIQELKQKINKYGFNEVKLSKNNKTKDYMVARLVAEHFIPNAEQKPEVMHISKDKQDNSVDNLEWGYKSEVRHNMYNKGSRRVGVPSFTKITYNGKNYKKVMDIPKDIGMNPRTFYKRYYERHWGLYEALEIPVGRSSYGS